MKHCCLFFLFIIPALQAQFISADHLAFSDQLLIEEVLFGDSECVEDVLVTNTVSGNFGDGMKSYGYFTGPAIPSFPFASGIVLSTGRLDNTEGPNDSLSDDDAPGWGGDQDLRDALNIPNSEVLTNATSISFNFTPKASKLSFDYIFASEEYQENNSNTCIYSDVFAFLIRPVGSEEFENIALIPDTTTPVKVTTVRPEIPGACPAENEDWFGQFNQSGGADLVSPTNFNGQTKVLKAVANLIPNQEYEVKLVIADEGNHRYDSAVFIDGGNFGVGVNLGLDRTGERAICEGDEVELDVSEDNPTTVSWFFNGSLVAENQETFTVSENELGAGIYAVEVTLDNGCITTDEITMEFQVNSQPEPFSLVTCGDENESNSNFNLLFIENEVNQLPNNFSIQEFYLTEENAVNQTNAIPNPDQFSSEASNTSVFVRLENSGGCELIVPIILQNNSFEYDAFSIVECLDFDENELFFNTNQLRNSILNFTGEQVEEVIIYTSRIDALQDNNRIIADNFSVDFTEFPTTYYARLQDTSECLGLVPIDFLLAEKPEFGTTETSLTLCRENDFLILDPQLENMDDGLELLWSTGEITPSIQVSEAGVYSLLATRTTSYNGGEISCSQEIEFNVDIAGIEEVDIVITGQPNQTRTAIINVLPPGNYQYALNDSNQFQSQNSFVLSQVENTVYIRDEEGCSEISRSFSIIEFPDFFTPNADGINDFWRPRGIQNESINLKSVQIFDRFGKLLISFGPGGFWDGTFNGKPVPPNDYWYRVKLSRNRVYTGNITLKR